MGTTVETKDIDGVGWTEIGGSEAAGIAQFDGNGFYAESATTPAAGVVGHPIDDGHAYPKRSTEKAWARPQVNGISIRVVFTPNE